MNIVESHKAPYKSKRVPIRLTKKAEERYKIGSLQIPDTYQLEFVLKTKAFKKGSQRYEKEGELIQAPSSVVRLYNTFFLAGLWDATIILK